MMPFAWVKKAEFRLRCYSLGAHHHVSHPQMQQALAHQPQKSIEQDSFATKTLLVSFILKIAFLKKRVQPSSPIGSANLHFHHQLVLFNRSSLNVRLQTIFCTKLRKFPDWKYFENMDTVFWTRAIVLFLLGVIAGTAACYYFCSKFKLCEPCWVKINIFGEIAQNCKGR